MTGTSIRIGLTGDVMLGRLVNEQVAVAGYRYPWGNMLPVLKSTDLNIINLETTLTLHGEPAEKAFNFRAEPDRTQSLKEANVSMANIANNHIMDFGEEGLNETIAALDRAGIMHTGAGKNLEEAKKPAIVDKKGIKIAAIGCTDNEPEWGATAKKPGTFFVEAGEIEKIAPEIRTLRGKADIVVVTMHWGPNMRERPTNEFVKFAHDIVDAGADIVHGHSAHIFQGVEKYKKGLIIYDAGDFVDDYAVDPALRNDLSFFFVITAAKEGIENAGLIPVKISMMQVNRSGGIECGMAVEKVKSLSEEFGTRLEENEIVKIKWK